MTQLLFLKKNDGIMFGLNVEPFIKTIFFSFKDFLYFDIYFVIAFFLYLGRTSYL